MMKRYLISQEDNVNYDTFDKAVVCAESEDEARGIHPAHNGIDDGWEYDCGEWTKNVDLVTVQYIGEAKKNMGKCVILASFCAG